MGDVKFMAGGVYSDDLTDEQLRELEERLYDREQDGEDTWFEHDLVLNEMNRRGMMDRPPSLHKNG